MERTESRSSNVLLIGAIAALIVGLLAWSPLSEQSEAAPSTAAPEALAYQVGPPLPGGFLPATVAMFARYDGIDGEAKDAEHDKWIDVLSVDWGAHKPGGGATGQSRRRGAAVVEDLTLTMEYEKASPKLQEKCLKGEIIPKLEIEQTATYGGARATYLRYELTNVMITSYQVSAALGERPQLVLTNNFEEIKVTYTEYDEEGQPVGTTEFVHKTRG